MMYLTVGCRGEREREESRVGYNVVLPTLPTYLTCTCAYLSSAYSRE